jgi:AGZA family xanthine/uracil permease-like MFS transporter
VPNLIFVPIPSGLGANLPVAMAPVMGMNAYFTYSVVGFRGSNNVSFDAANTSVLIEGIILLLLSASGAIQKILKWIPEPVRLATPAAIGAFLAHIGLQTAEGLGIVVADIATAVTIGGCPESHRTPMVQYDATCQSEGDCLQSDAYTCDVEGGIMTSATTWAGIVGTMIMLAMLSYRKQSAFLVGISLVAFVSWFRNTSLTYFPDSEIGNERFDYFKQVVSLEPLNKLMINFTTDLGGAGMPMFTFLYVHLLNESGTLLALTSAMGIANNNPNSDEEVFPRSRQAFAASAMSTIVGSLFCLSPTLAFMESAAGIAAGARTGLTACFCGFFFFLSIFFAPVIASIPPWATGGALVILGCLMARSLQFIRWDDPAHAATAFLTVMIMPLTYSIANGMLAGIACWLVLQSIFRILAWMGIERPVWDDGDMDTSPTAAENDEDNKESEMNREEASETSLPTCSNGDGDSESSLPIEVEELTV